MGRMYSEGRVSSIYIVARVDSVGRVGRVNSGQSEQSRCSCSDGAAVVRPWGDELLQI